MTVQVSVIGLGQDGVVEVIEKPVVANEIADEGHGIAVIVVLYENVG